MPLREDSIPTDSKYEDGDEYEYEEGGGFDGGGSHENDEDDSTHHAADDISFSDTKSDQVLSSQVVATLSDLGHYNRMTNTYQLNHRDAGSCLKDFIRFLRNDGLNFLVRRQMGISNIVSNDLLPIVEQHTVNAQSGAITEVSKSIMDKVIRLLVDLTNPTMLHYKNQQAPKEDKHEVQIYMELQQMLYQYKVAFALHKRFWIVLSKHLTRILELEEEERQVEDGLMFERIIVLIRNVLHIPLMDTATTEDINAHDRVIEQMHHAGILDILQYMISADEYKDYCFHLAEILYLLFREQSAEFLAKSVEGDPLASAHLDKETRDQLLASSGRSSFEVECDRREMDEVRLRDRQINAVIAAKFDAKSASNRYARPTYVVKNMKSISDRDIICHQPYMNPEVEIDLNRNKSAKMRARNRRPMAENMDNSDALGVQRIHRSSRKLRLILHEFCQKFLADCYNGFMGTVKANLSRGAAQDHDETYYVWAMQFFMEFNRHRPKATAEERYRQVYETMATSTFHYLQTLVDDYLDHLAQKKLFKLEMSDWSKRLHCALRSYRELLFSLSTLSGLDLVEAQKMCHRIKQDIFTEPDYREMLLRLLQAYNEERMSKAYLRDLIETNHVFLKMLDYHAKISFDFKVKFKKRKRKAPKKAKKSDEPEPEVEPEEEPVNPDELWTELIDEVSNVLQSKTLSEESVIGEHEELRELFDPLTDASLDDQKLGAMRKVCQLLRKKEVESAIRLFREARHALAGLDDENAFGEIGIAPEDELLALNEVMMVEFPEEEKKKKVEEENDEEVDEEEEEEEAFRSSSMHEAAFSLEDTVRRYAHPNVLRAYRLMLRNYKSNSIMTNHSIVRMLYRIAVDLKMVPMFYNFGYFLIFESILADPLYAPARAPTKKPSSSLESVVEELGQFARFVTRKFFKLLEKYPNIPCELCFAANSRDSYAMEMGFDEQQVAALLKEKKKKVLWTDEQELELEVLVKECRDKVVANNKEKDLVDLVQEKLMDESKTRRQILKKLKEMGLLQESDLKTKTSWKGPAWTVDELVELRELYQKFKDVHDFSEFAPSLPIVQEDSADKPPPLTTMIEESFSVEPPQEVPVDEGQDEKVSEDGPKDVDETPKEPSTDDVPVQEGDDDEASNDKNQSKKVQPKPKRADIIDAILQGLTTRDKRNRRQVMRQLKSMNIYDHSGGKKWTPEHLEELRTVFCNLFIDYKEYRDKEEEETLRKEEEGSTRNDEEESSQKEENDKEKSSDMKEKKKKRKVLIDDDDSGMEEEEKSSKKNEEDLEESSQKEGKESSRMEEGEESSRKNEDNDPQDEQSIDKESMKKKKRAVLFDSDDEEDESSKKNKEGDEESSRKDEEDESSRKNEDKKQETSREDFNFSLKFQSKFSDKSKSWSQILRQLKKMGFDESLKTMGLIKTAGGKGGRGNDEKKSTFVGNEFVDSSGSSDEEEEVERPEVDDDKDDDSSDDEGQRSHQRDKSRSSRTTKNYSMFEREDVVVQYDSEDDEDSREVSTTTIKASRTSMELAAILEDIPDVVEDASQPEDHVIKSSEVKSSVPKSSVSLQVDESESAQKKKAKLSENKKKLERLRQFMINNDNGEDESDDEEEEESSQKEEIFRKQEEKVADKKKSSSSDKQAQRKKKRKVLIDEGDSDKEEEEESFRKDEDSDSSSAQDEPIDKKKSIKKKKRAVLIDSDNEEEEERSRKDEEEENLSLNDDSLDKNQNPRSNKRKLMDSDDEEGEESSRKNEDKDDSMVMQVDDDKEEEESSYQSKNKKKRVILDDDDDE